MATKALSAGIHTFVEKPMTTTLSDGKALIGRQRAPTDSLPLVSSRGSTHRSLH
jgi:hypothetical protein